MTRISIVCLAVALLAGGAAAQFNWTDGFEAYNLGSLCSFPTCGNAGNSGGWTGWDNVQGASGTVVNAATAVPPVPAHTGTKFLQIGSTSDAIQPWSLNYPGTNPTSGIWQISAWSYVPTGGLTAPTYFIINNVYNHLGPYNWAVELQFMTTGVVQDDQRTGSVPVVFDQWVRILITVDLTGNTVTIKYNNQQISSGVWTIAGGVAAIANIDLYSGGTIFYDDLSVQPAVPNYETNSPGSSLDFNGVQTGGLTKALTQVCAAATVTAHSGGATGLPWEAAYNLAPTVPAGSPGSVTTLGGQVINLDLTAGIFFFMGGAVPLLTPYFGPFTATFNPGLPPGTILSFQQFNVDPGNVEGFSLSQAAQLNISLSGSVAGPTGDDQATTVTVAASPLCAPGSVMMYGTAYTQIHVITNGRVTFGVANTSWSPSAAAAQTGPAFVGAWGDLIVTPPGNSILVDLMNPTTVRVRYIAVPYLSYAVPNTFDLEFNTATGSVVINGLGGLGIAAATQMVGMSPGTAATDPGAVAFFPPTTGVTTSGTAMIYALGTGGSLTTGLSSISFYPNAYNNYDWISQ